MASPIKKIGKVSRYQNEADILILFELMLAIFNLWTVWLSWRTSNWPISDLFHTLCHWTLLYLRVLYSDFSMLRQRSRSWI